MKLISLSLMTLVSTFAYGQEAKLVPVDLNPSCEEYIRQLDNRSKSEQEKVQSSFSQGIVVGGIITAFPRALPNDIMEIKSEVEEICRESKADLLGALGAVIAKNRERSKTIVDELDEGSKKLHEG